MNIVCIENYLLVEFAAPRQPVVIELESCRYESSAEDIYDSFRTEDAPALDELSQTETVAAFHNILEPRKREIIFNDGKFYNSIDKNLFYSLLPAGAVRAYFCERRFLSPTAPPAPPN